VANAIYPEWKEMLLDLTSGADLNSGNVKAVLVDGADYTYSAAHDFLDDVPSGARVATSGNLASKTIASGVFDSADFTFTAVTGDPCEILIIYIDSGSAATSPLVAYYDTGVTGFPVTPNGGDINVTVHASGWFTL
jgi:hypothetical protein